MRLGFILGFLLGAGIASLFTLAERAEAPSPEEEMQPSEPAEEVKKQARKILAQLGDKIREAREAGREAALEKEAELLAEYEEAKRRAREAHPKP